MRPECIQAVRAHAEKLGRKVADADLRNIEDRIKNARTQLAKQDIDAYRDMTSQQQVEAAAKLVSDEIIAKKVLDKQRAAQSIQKKFAVRQEVEGLAAATGESQLATLFRVLFQKLDGKGSTFSLENRIRATKKYYHHQLADLFDLADRGYLGSLFADPEGTKALTYELYGKDSGNPMAKQAAEAIRKVIDRQLKDYRAEGGAINKLENWRHPQHTSPRLAHSLGQKEWVSFVRGKLDRSQYRNPDGSAMSDAQLDTFLGQAWKSIALDGAGKPADASHGQGIGALGNQRKAHRQLFFKDADAWMEYHGKLGEKDMYSVMLDHIDGLSSDIATMKVLSHNPKAFLQSLIDDARVKDADTNAGGPPAGAQKVLSAIFGDQANGLWDDATKLEKAFDYLVGGMDRPSNTRLARVLRGYRNLKVSSLLGSLPASMLPDQGTMKMIARQNQVAAGLIWEGQKRWATSPSFRDNLRAMGLALENAGEELSRLGERNGTMSKTGMLATAVHRLSGATAINTMERSAMEFALTHTWARLVAKHERLADLHPDDHKVLLSKGITENDWAVWRLAEQDDLDGTKLLTPRAIDSVLPEKIVAAIPEKAEAIRQETAEFIARMEKRNTQENEWLAGRLAKFESYKEKLDKALTDFKAVREKHKGELSERVGAQAELLQARIAQAEAHADIAAYLKTADSIAAQRGFLEAVEDGASIERGTVRRRDWADRAADAVVTDWAKTPGVGEKSAAEVQRLSRERGALGEKLGAKREKADRQIRELEKRLKEMERASTKEVSSKERELTERMYKRMMELADFTAGMNERVGKRQAAIKEWQDSVTPKIQRAAESAKGEATLKLYGALDGEVNTAVLQPSALDNFGLKTLGGALNPSSTMGEVMQTVLQFKAFPWAYFRRHHDRMMMESGTMNRAKYALGTMALTTAWAGAGITLLAMARGEDPTDVTEDPAAFGLKAFMKGGGMGFYGDILLTPDQFGSNPADQLYGPVVGDFNRAVGVLKLAKDLPFSDDPDKDADKIAKNAVRLLKENTPFQNLWYTRVMTDRWLFNQMQEWANPGAMARMKNNAAKRGTSYWWQPGDALPDRAPDVGKAVGESSTQ